jgi:NAD-dependent DNA ligase
MMERDHQDELMGSPSIRASLEHQQIRRSVEQLLGIVSGITADGQLNAQEVLFLRTWLNENQAAASVWPGTAIARQLDTVLQDGVITHDELAHLLDVLKRLLGSSFDETGSVSREPTALPVNDDVPVDFNGASVCFTGTFIYGTRSSCARLTEKAGALIIESVSGKLRYLVIGGVITESWAHSSFGRKIQKAAEMRGQGHPIDIISEQRWMDALRHHT